MSPSLTRGSDGRRCDISLYRICGKGDKSRTGAMATVLGADMLTIREAPVFVAPGCEYGAGTGFEGHEFLRHLPSVK